MPGSSFTFVCSGCSARHRIETGAGFSAEHDARWRWEQRVCSRCRTLRSQPVPDLWDDGPGCPGCGSELVPWQGRVWHERDEQGRIGAERVEGPCPRCRTTITTDDAIEIGAWD